MPTKNEIWDIVNAHVLAMRADLRAAGVTHVAVVGGVAIAPNTVETFCMIDPEPVFDGVPVDGTIMLRTVGVALVRSADMDAGESRVPIGQA